MKEKPREKHEKKKQREPGRYDVWEKGNTKRPAGKSTARDMTGVNPQEPIDPESPTLIRS
jgi:hypothetical protein